MNIDFNNKSIGELKNWIHQFHLFYSYSSSFHAKSRNQLFLGNKDNKICRYCRLDSKMTTFKKNAHLFPAFLGNRNVKSHYECDNCNSIFGKYENDLASFIGLRRYYDTPDNYGKKRNPIFKLPGSNATFHLSKRALEINDPNNEIFEVIEKDKIIKSRVNKSPYIPLNVYKSIVKICLSALEDISLNNFSNILEFLLTNKFDEDISIKTFAKLFFHSLSDFYIEYPILYVYQKNKSLTKYEMENNVWIPINTFILYFRDFCYQIFLPFNKYDEINIQTKKRLVFPIFPPILTEPKNTSKMNIYTEYYHEFKDLSITSKIINEKDEFYFKFLSKPIVFTYSEEEYENIIKKFNLRKRKK